MGFVGGERNGPLHIHVCLCVHTCTHACGGYWGLRLPFQCLLPTCSTWKGLGRHPRAAWPWLGLHEILVASRALWSR